MSDRHRVAMVLLHPGTPRDQEAWTSLRAALPGAETIQPDDVGAFEFLEHPELPDHWRERSRPSGA